MYDVVVTQYMTNIGILKMVNYSIILCYYVFMKYRYLCFTIINIAFSYLCPEYACNFCFWTLNNHQSVNLITYPHANYLCQCQLKIVSYYVFSGK